MKRRNVLLLVLLLVIGFAAVSTSLILNGTIGIGAKTDDFDVIFVDAALDGEKLDSLISADKKSITFTSKMLRELNESTKLTYKVKNNSTQYGADVTISCNTYGNENIEITGKFAGIDIPLTNPIEMSSQEVKEGYLKAEVVKVYGGEDTSISIECKIVASATSKEDVIEYVPLPYSENILNGADPVLTPTVQTRSANNKELIPVTLANDGTVTYADINEKWYSYANKEWANAIILRDTYERLNEEGSIHGATKENGYVSLDGQDDYIDLGYANYDFSNGITLAAKVKLLQKNTITAYIIDNLQSAGSSISISSDQEVRVSFHVNGSYKTIYTDEPLEIGKEYTIVATYDNEIMKLYIDGQLIKSNEESGMVKTSSMPYFLGANPEKTNHINFANIDVYQAAIYDRAVSEEEVKENFKNEIKITNKDRLLTYANFTNKRSVGEIILENDIESYFVWVPRYKYQIFDEGNYTEVIEGKPTESNAKEIDIKFESKDVTPSSGSKKEEWLTHPAFTNFDVNGLWVGKFETGYAGASTKEDAQVNAIDASKVIIKPNAYSWRNNTVSNMFKTAYDYNRNLDSHMIKNTEWGAVAYLSHSKYGINTEVRINNNSDYLTGYAATDSTDQTNYPGESGTDETKTNAYNTPTGYKASTTGNITGIYDMSGGAHEYVAGYVESAKDASGFILTDFTTYRKYFNIYPTDSSSLTFNNRILGDATGEMGPFYYYANTDGSKRNHSSWYGDHANFINSNTPWFIRGGFYGRGLHAGQFNLDRYTGDATDNIGSRLVLAI